MRVVIDAFGGDNAPLSNIKGARLARDGYGAEIILAGDEAEIKRAAGESSVSLEGIDIAPAKGVFSMHEEPTALLKEGKDTSLAVACRLVAEGGADAVVSAGNTGALVVGGTFLIKRIKGIKRPAFGTLIPSVGEPFFLMDMGANSECRPEMLEQFAVMSTIYCKSVLGMSDPTVGLLNIGTEETKGTDLQREAYRLLQNSPVIHFTGNVEAREVPNHACDIVIADGFTGNIALKLYEGVTMAMFGAVKKIFKKNLATKLAASLVMSGLRELKGKADYSSVGGAPLLGVRGGVIKAHGSSGPEAICQAVRQALFFCENHVAEKIAENITPPAEGDER